MVAMKLVVFDWKKSNTEKAKLRGQVRTCAKRRKPWTTAVAKLRAKVRGVALQGNAWLDWSYDDKEAQVWQALRVALMLVKTHGKKSMVTTLCGTTSQRTRRTCGTVTNVKANR